MQKQFQTGSMYPNGIYAVDGDTAFMSKSVPCYFNLCPTIDFNGRDLRRELSSRPQSTRVKPPTIQYRSKRKLNRRRNDAQHRGYSPSVAEADNRMHYLVAGHRPRQPHYASFVGFVPGLVTDDEASQRVMGCFKKHKNGFASRVVRKLLKDELALGLESLDTIMIATDNVFFNGKLRGRVHWRWSDAGEEGYEKELLGTTRPQYSIETGIEARIVLSRPLLKSGRYSQDLLLSTFLHELVHCYLFICCGDQAQQDGGHTPGFQRIVHLINSWIGNSRLRLCNMKADLDHFVIDSDEARCQTPVEDRYRVFPAPQYTDFNGCTFVCEADDQTLLLGGEDVEVPVEFDRAHLNVSLPSLAKLPSMAYVSMQERVMTGGSFSMPIVID